LTEVVLKGGRKMGNEEYRIDDSGFPEVPSEIRLISDKQNPGQGRQM
jgi:hypothetical protein